MSKVLITDYVHPKLITQLQELAYEPVYDLDFDPDSIGDVIHQYQGVIINSKIKMSSEVIKKAKKLKFIGRLGSGLEIIDLEAAAQSSIKVFNTPEGNRNAVAEHAIGMLLALSNNLILADKDVRHFEWNRESNRGNEISNMNVGIIGFGHTGKAFAKRLMGFETQIYFYDPFVKDIPDELNHCKKVDLSQIYHCNVISFHVPLNTTTTHMLNIEFINRCTQKPIVINTSRGKVVDTQAIIKGLELGILSGACLDVLENEKPYNYSIEEKKMYELLFSMPNVVLSPHIAGWTHQSLELIATVLLNKIRTL